MIKFILSQPYSFLQNGRRSSQQDARYPDCDAPQGVAPVFVVCDGVGGQQGGDIASRTVADAIGEEMKNYNLAEPFTVDDFEQVMAVAYRAIDEAARHTGMPDMATTLTFVCFHGGGVFQAHAGDSRIYHVRPGVGILRQSSDHSLVNALVRSGNLSPEEARNHPQSNIITRCIRPTAAAGYEAIDTIQTDDVAPGDYFFMCTDGVVHELENGRLYEILCDDTDDKAKIDEIARICRDSSDNNTAYLIRLDRVEGAEPRETLSVEDESSTATRPINPDKGVVEAFATGTPGKKDAIGRLSRIFKKIFK